MGTTPVVYSTSAALLFTEQELGGPCTEVESAPIASAVSPSVIVEGNGDRVGLVIMNLGANNVNISLQGLVTANNGILLVGNGGSISLTVRDDFTLAARQWSALASGGSSQLYVLEIIRFRSLEVG